MSALAEIDNVTAVKQANADLEQAKHIVGLGLDLYAGDDDLVLPFLEVGGTGGVCVHTHIVGPQVRQLVRRFRAGDVEAARQIDRELAPSIELPGSRRTRSRSSGRSSCSATTWAACGCRSSKRTTTRPPGSGTAWSGSACSSRPLSSARPP